MCRPHGTAFLPPDVCMRKERKEQRKEKERKEKKKKRKKTSHTQPGYPSLIIIIIEPSNPTNLLTILFILSSSHLQSSKNPTISMLNSNLAYPPKKKSQQQPKTNNQVCLSVCVKTRKTKKKNLHFTGQRSCPHSKFAQIFCSTIVSAPQRQHVQRGQGSYTHYPDTTDKHISFIQLKCFDLWDGFFFWTYPRSSRSTIRNSR